jgi:DNA-binding response OmpR family regulator
VLEVAGRAVGADLEGFGRTVDAHVKNLRRKLEEAGPGLSGVVQTVYGVGYRFDDEL